MTTSSKLKEIAIAFGASLFGVADIIEIKKKFLIEPAGILEGLDKAVSVGYRLSQAVLESNVGGPSLLYSFHYKRANQLLDDIVLRISGYIQAEGYRVLPIPASQLIDWEDQRAHLSHREIARLAGHGWRGKNNLLVNTKFGASVRYATVLTDMPLEANTPVDDDCGSCSACIDKCPAGAIKSSRAEFDLKKCYEALCGFSKRRGVGQHICGICVGTCKSRV